MFLYLNFFKLKYFPLETEFFGSLLSIALLQNDFSNFFSINFQIFSKKKDVTQNEGYSAVLIKLAG